MASLLQLLRIDRYGPGATTEVRGGQNEDDSKRSSHVQKYSRAPKRVEYKSRQAPTCTASATVVVPGSSSIESIYQRTFNPSIAPAFRARSHLHPRLSGLFARSLLSGRQLSQEPITCRPVKTSHRPIAEKERENEEGYIAKPTSAITVGASAPVFRYLLIIALGAATFNFSLGDGSDTWEEVNPVSGAQRAKCIG